MSLAFGDLGNHDPIRRVPYSFRVLCEMGGKPQTPSDPLIGPHATLETMNESLIPDPTPSAPGAPSPLFTAHCDGGSRGNPGPSGYGAVIEDSKGQVVAELSEFLGIRTTNYAEYSGLLAVLRWSVEHNVKHLRVVSDSELMVKQMQGKYKVASPILRPLFEEARKLSRTIASFEIRHTLRGGNKHADKLANDAMDKGMGRNRPA